MWHDRNSTRFEWVILDTLQIASYRTLSYTPSLPSPLHRHPTSETELLLSYYLYFISFMLRLSSGNRYGFRLKTIFVSLILFERRALELYIHTMSSCNSLDTRTKNEYHRAARHWQFSFAKHLPASIRSYTCFRSSEKASQLWCCANISAQRVCLSWAMASKQRKKKCHWPNNRKRYCISALILSSCLVFFSNNIVCITTDSCVLSEMCGGDRRCTDRNQNKK